MAKSGYVNIVIRKGDLKMDNEPIEVERGTVCFHKMNWMQNEATQNLRDFIRSLVDNLTTPFIRKVAMMEQKFDNVCHALEKERKELKELTDYIKSYELVKEQEIKNLFSKLEQLETNQEILK
jgi:hypothetical protein